MIPTWHDPAVRDLVAHWRILTERWPSVWDPENRVSWHRPIDDAASATHVAALAAAGLDPRVLTAIDHDETIAQLRAGAAAWTRQAAADAFIAGLWSAPAAWRSALPGVLLADVMPEHGHVAWSADSSDVCQVCGFRERGGRQRVGEWSFRVTSGTPLDGEPTGYAEVFDWFGDGRPEPTEYDRWALGGIRTVLRSLPAGTRYSAAAKAIDAAKILRTREGSEVLETLAFVGVLASEEHPGMIERFTTYRERDQRPNIRVEVQSPLAYWTTAVGDHGVRVDLWDAVFPDTPTVDLDGRRPTQQPASRATITGGLAARVRALSPKPESAAASVGAGPVAAGDVWAMRIRPGVWFTFYVHDVHERGRPFARVEPLARLFEAQPTAEQISDAVQPRYDGRSVMYGHSVEKTPWTRRIAQGVPAPSGDGDVPERGSWQALSHLRSLAEGWHFRD